MHSMLMSAEGTKVRQPGSRTLGVEDVVALGSLLQRQDVADDRLRPQLAVLLRWNANIGSGPGERRQRQRRSDAVHACWNNCCLPPCTHSTWMATQSVSMVDGKGSGGSMTCNERIACLDHAQQLLPKRLHGRLASAHVQAL